MDWAIINLDKHLSDRLIPQQPTPDSMPDADTRFHASLASRSIHIRWLSHITITIPIQFALTITTVAPSPIPDDCRLALDETTSQLWAVYGADDLASDSGRKEAALNYLDEIFLPPFPRHFFA